MDRDRKPGQRAGLSHDQVYSAAQELLTERGLERFSMRAVARSLGVAPNALYSHVSSREELLDDLLDSVLALVAAPDPEEGDPVEGITLLMESTYDVLTSQPALVPVYLSRQGARGPHAVRLGKVLDACLLKAGVPHVKIPDARRVLIVHTIGFAAFSTTAPDGDRPMSPDTTRANFSMSLCWMVNGILANT